jgi:hypothetical protein
MNLVDPVRRGARCDESFAHVGHAIEEHGHALERASSQIANTRRRVMMAMLS